MNLTFLGAAGTVTGSKYLVETSGRRLLVDCGLFQGLKKLRLKNRAPFPVDPSTIDAVLLTHAHLDHSGYLPLLVRNGFRGPIIASSATAELCELLLPDSARLQEEEAAFANRHGYSRHHPALPLYTERDAERALKQFSPVQSIAGEIEVATGLTATMHEAGHILGATMIRLRADGTTVLFSGDLGRSNDVLMRPPQPMPATDYLVLESTYGDRLHPDNDATERLAEAINRTVDRGGVMVIPAFAVGRAQALLYMIQQLKGEQKIERSLPVYLNSPMAVDATHILRDHPGEHRLSQEECAAIYRSVRFVNTVEESKELNRRREPMIIISAGGMATGGRVLHHIRAFAPHHENTVLFAGFQAPGTRGAAMVGGAEEVKIFGEYVPIRAEVLNLEGMSGHADYREILEWLRGASHPPHHTWLTHGEPAAADALRLRIADTLRWECSVPDEGDTVQLLPPG